MSIYAHSRKSGDLRPWQKLTDHLDSVGVLAASFASPQLASLARTAGRWHDVGKYHPDFQGYIEGDPELSNEDIAGPLVRRVPHAAAGAALALERFGETQIGAMLATAIAAHHGASGLLADMNPSPPPFI